MEYSGKCENKLIENYVVIDLEMTGLNARTEEILETGAVRVRGGMVTNTYTALVCPGRKLSEKVTELTGITEEMAQNGRKTDEVMEEFLEFLGEDTLVGHNVIFDYSFLKQWAVNHKCPLEYQALDTLKLARKFLPREQKKDLESLCSYLGIERRNAHRALDDALETQQILEWFLKEYGEEEEAFLPKPLLYRAKKQSPATEHQKKYLAQYAAYYGLELPVELERITKNEASRLVDKWNVRYGRMPKA